MPFDQQKITKNFIYNAVNKIEAENIRLHPSTVYDVIVNGKSYPPKEIIRISYELATGQEPGLLYGGKQVNNILNRLGFDIVEKNTVWKLGCNWNKSRPSFYQFIKKEKIVLSVSARQYKVGDLIAITQGFTVYAIARVSEEMKSVTDRSAYRSTFEGFQIDYEQWVLFSAAEWYELSKSEVFKYELQQGICKIRKSEIKEKVINIWDNRDKKAVNLIFYKTKYFTNLKFPRFPCFVLSSDSLDDYGYRTSFELSCYKSSGDFRYLGIVKILQKHHTITDIPDEFQSLTDDYCSLGQTLQFYSRLIEDFPDDFMEILKSTNDCAFFEEIAAKFADVPGFQKSLLRSSEALLILNEAKQLSENRFDHTLEKFRDISLLKTYNFNFSYRVPEAYLAHVIDFNFEWKNDLPNRFFCIIGKNGTGKTKILSQLAIKLANNNREGHFENGRPAFSKVVAASFSYFDNFLLPEPEDINYEFIGIRTVHGICTKHELTNIIWDAYSELVLNLEKRELWIECVKRSLELDYLSFDVDELDALSTKAEFTNKTEEIFSSGQKIIFHFLTRLISVIDLNSLLIFDEPETHLHPNITGRLLRTINLILSRFDSYCILATHSPIIVQEIPSKFIRIIDRRNNTPLVYSPVIECFGENLSTISNSIFYANEEKELYKQLFDLMAETLSLKDIEKNFDNKLSLNARLYLQSINASKK